MSDFTDNSSILVLPDLVLHQICSFISNPFDLLHFGNTCSRIREIASSNRLWWNLAMGWFTGLWPNVENFPSERNCREWLLAFLRDIEAPPSGTKILCDFKNGEVWERIDSKIFRCHLGTLQVAYVNRLKERHPAVLYERWLYDIGIYKRKQNAIDFHNLNVSFSSEVISELAAVGQAKERDLRARKQPYMNPMYYIKVMDVSHENWVNELFPSGFYGSICPLLLDPFKNAFTDEVSSVSGLLTCLSIVLEHRIVLHCKSKVIPVADVAHIMKQAIVGFKNFIQENLPVMKEMWGQYCLTRAVEHMSVQETFDMSNWQSCLNTLTIPLQCQSLIRDIRDLIRNRGGIDFVVDSIRLRWRNVLTSKIKEVLEPDATKQETVTRVNVTDSDLIGGDNVRQEMSAAAFISNSGVLVTWHLTGRLRY